MHNSLILEVLHEYEEILAQRMTREIAHNVVEAIARLHTTVYQEVYIHFGLIEKDADDNKFVDCAIAADAEYIDTNKEKNDHNVKMAKFLLQEKTRYNEEIAELQNLIKKGEDEAK